MKIPFSNKKINQRAKSDDTAKEHFNILSLTEPFIDFEITSLRHKLIDDVITNKIHADLVQAFSNSKTQDHTDLIIDTLAEIKTEIHYLKTAYIKSARYNDPNFSIQTPEYTPLIRPDTCDIDMRGDITGANWWHAEPTGRWAGPDNQSSIQIPALGYGKYRLEISVVSEIDDGIIDGMRTTFNGNELIVQKNSKGFPCELFSEFEVPESYRFPFFTIKFEFSKLKSPRENGLPDDRRLAIMLDHIRLTRLAG